MGSRGSGPSRRGDRSRGGGVRRARLLPRQPQRHREACRRRQGQPVPVLRRQTRPLRLHRRRRQPTGALVHGGPHPRTRPEQTVLRVPDRPARHLGGVLRRQSPRPRTAWRGDPGGGHGCPRQRTDRHPSPLSRSPAATGARRAHSRRPARGLRHRRVVVASADDLPAYGARAVRARDGSHPRTRRAHSRTACTRRAQARRSPVGRILFQKPSPVDDQGGQRMTRKNSATLDAGGLNWASLPMKLFAGGNAKFWNPADIDFSRDREDWESLTELERDYAARLCAQFIAGEEAVTQDIQPFMAAMRAEGRLADEMYLTQFAFEEAKHTQVFRMWLDAVGLTGDLQHYLDDLPNYQKIFYEELPESLDALSTDPSPAAQIRASATYNHVIEGMMALTGYYAWHRICVDRGILPGMQELVKRIGDDERRHMAWGTFTCRRHVAADDRNWGVFETRMNELIPLALQNTEDAYALYDEVPFDLAKDEIQQYATDKGMRRFGTISSARGRPVEEIDLDYSPLRLEDEFASEDQKALAALV